MFKNAQGTKMDKTKCTKMHKMDKNWTKKIKWTKLYKKAIVQKPESEAKKTTLTSYIQKLEDKKEKYSVKWAIHKRAFSYKPGNSFCSLCLTEKTEILMADPRRTLNRRNELLEKCRHRAKFKLK